MEKQLIYIPPGTNGPKKNWVSSGSCVWGGGACLRKTIWLSNHYPQLRAFFLGTLQLKDAYTKTLTEEVYQITAADDLKYISQLFLALALQLAKETEALDDEVVKSFCQRSIFPVKTATSQSTFDSLRAAQDSDIWFIADRRHLRQSFEGLLPLLAFTVEDIAEMGDLVKGLGLSHRLLSEAATETPTPEGRLEFDAIYTNSLRRKARFIAR